ncbi:hypothetical protein [Lacinutrix undariae]
MQKLLIILLISNFIFLDVGNIFNKTNNQETKSELIGCWSAMELITEENRGFLRFIKRKNKYSGINYEFKKNKIINWQITSVMCGSTKIEKPQKGSGKWEISKDSILEIKYKNESTSFPLGKYKLTKLNESELLLEMLE